MIAKVLSVLGIFFIGFGVANAQKYNIKTYSVNDGLPSSQVFDVHLDDEGLVWFATAYGLVKFDGYNFETYDKRHGFRDEFVYDIFEDSNSRFWVSTYSGGVGVFAEDSLIYLEEFTPLDSMLVNFIIESPYTNELWFGTSDNGILIWDGNDFRKLSTDDGIPDNSVYEIKFSEDEKVWISTANGVAVYEEGKGITKIWGKEDGLSGAAAFQVFESSDGTMWIPTNNGFTTIKNDSLDTVTEINGQALNYVYSITEDDDGTIWIGTHRNGVYWYDEGDFTHITKKNGLSSNYVYRLVKAEDGTIWITTDGNGVSIFRDKEFKFYDNSSGLESNSVFSLFIDQEGAVWAGREGGLSRFKNGELKSYSIPTDMSQDEMEVWDIEQLPNGNLLLLTYNYMLIEFDGEQFFSSAMNDSLSDYYILDVLVEDNGVIWIAESEGLIKYEDGKYRNFKPGEEGTWQTYVTILYKDKKGDLWLGTEGGAAKFDGTDFTYYTQEDGLNGQSIYAIKEDAYGNMWVGTNKGVSVINLSNESGSPATIETFENEDVFLSETISLLVDKKGGVWQGTNGGLNYYDAEQWHETGTMKKMHFPLDDYGNGVEFNGSAAVIGEEGDLWFGTMKGLLHYDASAVPSPRKANPPNTFIRRILANGKVVYDQELNTAENLTLNNDQNNLEIEFGAVNYKDPFRLFYRFKLDGFDEDWITGFDRRRAYYTNLDPGEYTFSVVSKSSKSDWAESASVIDFEIEGPFWKKGWFLVLATLVFFGLVASYIKMHLTISERKKLKLLVDEQTKDLTKALGEKEVLIKEIHHRVKNNMAVISGLLELQSWQMEEGDARDAIEDSKLRIKTMSTIHEKLYQNKDLTGINFKEFAQDLVKNVSSSLKGMNKDIKVSINVDVEHLDVNTAIPCGLMLNELISNAYEHAFNETGSGTIDISFFEMDNDYVLKVADDGVGIPEEILQSERSSLGITLIQSLSSQLSADLNISGKNGTVVVLHIPKMEEGITS